MGMTLKQTLRYPRFSNQGVTLIELMIGMTIFLLVLGGIYSTFQSQHKSYLMQEEVAAMQQNIRAAMFYLTKEIRMAGCDPTGNAGAGIVTANANSISFTEDVRGDADGSDPDGATNDPNESIAYALSSNNLVRNTGGGNQVVAENFDALDFVYLDADGNTTATLTDIRSVEITIVARTGRALRVTKDNNLYYNQQGTQILGAQNDNFSRRSMTTFIKCRNLGI
ncbi:MAG: prepilin-type N-terminal cleavage/methylation domain-containing protein [Desulfobacterales bacterium]